MSTFGAEQSRDAAKPPKKVRLPPSAFADGPQKPDEPRDVGLRLISEGDVQNIRSYAARTTASSMKGVDQSSDLWIEAYNHELMLGAVCAALCHPEDASRDYWEMQRKAAPTYLSAGGIERLWDELESLKIESAPTAPEADESDIALLRNRLADQSFAARLPLGDARAIRRYLRHCLDVLETHDPPTPHE